MYTVDRLLRGGRPGESSGATLDRPLDHLVACHERIEERLRILERAAEALESKPNEARDAIASCFRYFESSGVLHTEDEEASVFPRVLPRLTAAERAYVEELEKEHRKADQIYGELRELPETAEQIDPYRAAVARFCALYRAHIASENARLIEMARRVLPDNEVAEIADEMRERRRNAGMPH